MLVCLPIGTVPASVNGFSLWNAEAYIAAGVVCMLRGFHLTCACHLTKSAGEAALAPAAFTTLYLPRGCRKITKPFFASVYDMGANGVLNSTLPTYSVAPRIRQDRFMQSIKESPCF